VYALSFTLADTLVHALSTFVSFPSISGSESSRENCRQAAIWLRTCLTQLGADASLVRGQAASCRDRFLMHVVQLSTGERTNPLVLATFTGSASAKQRKRILFYGCGLCG
jgi:di- and tripeptidase